MFSEKQTLFITFPRLKHSKLAMKRKNSFHFSKQSLPSHSSVKVFSCEALKLPDLLEQWRRWMLIMIPDPYLTHYFMLLYMMLFHLIPNHGFWSEQFEWLLKVKVQRVPQFPHLTALKQIWFGENQSPHLVLWTRVSRWTFWTARGKGKSWKIYENPKSVRLEKPSVQQIPTTLGQALKMA